MKKINNEKINYMFVRVYIEMNRKEERKTMNDPWRTI